MTQETWNRLTILEQMSNIGGEVKRCVETRNSFLSGASGKDYSNGYLEKVCKLSNMTVNDPKNESRKQEIYDEIDEIKQFLSGNASDEYILRYWGQYTDHIM